MLKRKNIAAPPYLLLDLLGGASGTEYLVAARGLEQPRAGKGVVRPGVERLYGTNTSQTIRWLTLGVSGSLFLKILSATGEKPIYIYTSEGCPQTK